MKLEKARKIEKEALDLSYEVWVAVRDALSRGRLGQAKSIIKENKQEVGK